MSEPFVIEQKQADSSYKQLIPLGYINPNLGDNTDFLNPVNQRGVTSTTTTGYFIDRWVIGLNSPTSASIASSGLVIATGANAVTFSQTVNITDITSIYTFSVCDNNKNVYSVTGVPDATTPTITPFGNIQIKISSGHPVMFIVVNANQTMQLRWAKIELGNIATPYIPKGYGVEVAECQRYYRKAKFFFVDSSSSRHTFVFSPPMRISPSVTWSTLDGSGTPVVVTTDIYQTLWKIESGYSYGTITADANF